MTTILQVLNRALKDENFWDQLLTDPKSALDSADFKLSQDDLIYLMGRLHNSVTAVNFERSRHKPPAPKEDLAKQKLSKVSSSITENTEFFDNSEEPRVPWS